MTQQTFWPEKVGDSVLYRSAFGDKRDDIAIPAHTPIEFKIFHGRGGTKFDFTIGLLLDGDHHKPSTKEGRR